MHISQTGIILNAENYEECVSFYKDLFGLNTVYSQAGGDLKITCLAFGDSYLMIESGGAAQPQAKTMEQGALKLRFNVPDIEVALETIRNYGIEAEITRRDWGSTIDIIDPDGNRIGIRDDATFKAQCTDWLNANR